MVFSLVLNTLALPLTVAAIWIIGFRIWSHSPANSMHTNKLRSDSSTGRVPCMVVKSACFMSLENMKTQQTVNSQPLWIKKRNALCWMAEWQFSSYSSAKKVALYGNFRGVCCANDQISWIHSCSGTGGSDQSEMSDVWHALVNLMCNTNTKKHQREKQETMEKWKCPCMRHKLLFGNVYEILCFHT